MDTANPLKTIRDHVKKGYTVRLALETSRSGFEVKMFTQSDVKRFSITKEIPLSELYAAVKGI